jgi:hypothetical protein
VGAKNRMGPFGRRKANLYGVFWFGWEYLRSLVLDAIRSDKGDMVRNQRLRMPIEGACLWPLKTGQAHLGVQKLICTVFFGLGGIFDEPCPGRDKE